MAIRDTGLVLPIKTLIKDKKEVISVYDKDVNDSVPNVDEFRKLPLNEFGGYGVRLSYRADGKLDTVSANQLNVKLVYEEGEGMLDHVEETYPNTTFKGMLRTNLDYSQGSNKKLEYVYSELIE